MKVLVTGADGFVGRSLLRRLLDDGREVCGAVRPDQRPPARGGSGELTAEERHAVRWLPLELTDPESVRRLADLPYDGVVHLAAVSSVSDAARDPGYAWTVNAAGTARLVQVLAEAKRAGRADPLVLVVSTGEVYGACDEQRPRREMDPVAPCSPYAASKAGAELAALEIWRRPSFGPWLRGRSRTRGRARRRGSWCRPSRSASSSRSASAPRWSRWETSSPCASSCTCRTSWMPTRGC